MSTELGEFNLTWRDLVAATGLRPSHGNELELLVGGTRFVPVMLEAIAKANESISIEMYTLRRGVLASAVVSALSEQAARGVQVTLVLDAFGSRFLPRRLLRQLQDSGAIVRFFSPLRWSKLGRYLVRDHRKIFTFDRTLAFLGGMSIDDVFIGKNGLCAWHEVMLRVRGPLVSQIDHMFGQMYAALVGKAGHVYVTNEIRVAEDGSAALLASEPGTTHGRNAYIQAIGAARHSIEVTTPYFAPEDAVVSGLVGAAERGVDIRLVTAGQHTNARMVQWISRAYYQRLRESGIRIFEPRRRMMHAKTMLIDKAIWIVGSTNIDGRSFYVNMEADVIGCDTRVADALSAAFASLERESDEISDSMVGLIQGLVRAGCARLLARHL